MINQLNKMENYTFSLDEGLFKITNLQYQLSQAEGEIELTWKWFKDVDGVLIYTLDPHEPISEKTLLSNKHTRIASAEFEKRMGKVNIKISLAGLVKIIIFPFYKEGTNTVIALQNNDENSFEIIAKRKNIYYRITDKSSFINKILKKGKEVEIFVYSDEVIPPNTLEYIYSNGSWPISQEIGDEGFRETLIEPIDSQVSIRLLNPHKTAQMYNIRKMKNV